MPKITRVLERSVFHNRIGTLFNDEVIGPMGDRGNYLRWAWRTDAVSIVPRRGSLFGIAKMFRYPIDQFSMEFPRGGLGENESPVEGAHRELREEAGLFGTRFAVLGTVFADTGLIQSPLHVVEIEVSDVKAPTNEKFESITDIFWLEAGDFISQIQTGQITCAITIASFMLSLEKVVQK